MHSEHSCNQHLHEFCQQSLGQQVPIYSVSCTLTHCSTFRVEKKALMDDCPSKDVYSQLQSLSKQNPWFVQSLQSIMTQNILAEDCMPHLPQMPEASDPQISNQAVLALLLAAYLKPQQGLQQGTASLSSLIKQLESGTSAIDLLKNARFVLLLFRYRIHTKLQPCTPLVNGYFREMHLK